MVKKLALYGGKPVKKILLKFHQPFLGPEEERAILNTLHSGRVGGGGLRSRQLEEEMRKRLGARYVLTTSSGTAALELAMMALDIKMGDEVILPSFTFVSTANAVVRVGASPVFVDIREEDFNIDSDKIKSAINKRTKAIIVVHYAGVACNMNKILSLAKRYNLFVIEDAAHAIGAKYRDRYLGTIGKIGCFSFHQTKNITCGEGGAFVTEDKKVFQKAEIIREKGTNRSAFLRGEIDKYTWIDCGSSFVLSDLLSAVAIEQLKKMSFINRMRRKNANYLLRNLQLLEKEGKLKLPHNINKSYQTNWHIFAIRVKATIRNWVISALKAEGIEATFHFVPLHNAPFARRILKLDYTLPITERISQEIIRLPIYPQLEKSDLDDIVTALNKVLTYTRNING